MNLHTTEDLTSCILDFQANMVRVTNRKKTTPVDPRNSAHMAALEQIWEGSNLQTQMDPEGRPVKWRSLGFDSENVAYEFNDTGILGLECLVCLSHFLLIYTY